CPTVVTASVERFDFLAPAFIGDLVSVNCEIHYAGRTSMEIGVEVTAEDLMSREVRKIASSFVIYVALDENRKPTLIPPLLPSDDTEKAIIERAHIRRLHRQKRDEALLQAEERKD
ncbi:MAG: acyl-CoA thioesterase, partial [Ktedonobacteraceae bacterium]|nr:acyl-CoA thioesterase [Ktedonobacteraceae bacterium]